MAARPVKIAFLADTADLRQNLSKAEAAMDSAAAEAKSAGQKIEGAFDATGAAADGLATTSAQTAGGIGDIAGALEATGLISEGTAQSMETASAAIMGITGVSDLANVVFEKLKLTTLGSTVITYAKAAADKVAAGAAKAWAAAQAVLNAVMAGNPIALVVIAIVALIAIMVIAYKKSETFRNIVDKAWAAIKNATKTVFEWIKDKIQAVFNWLVSTVPGKIGAAKDAVVNGWNTIKTRTAEIWEGIKDGVAAKVTAVVEKVKDIKTKVTNFFSNAASWLIGEGRQLISGLISGIGEKFGDITSKIGEIKDKVTGKFSAAATWLTQAGKDVLNGLIAGLDAAKQWVINKIQEITDMIPGWVKKRLGIASPSKVMKELGKHTGQGLVLGIDSMGSKTARAASHLAGAVVDGFGAPELGVGMAANGNMRLTSEANNRQTLHITLTSQQIDQLSRGRAIQADLDAFARAGGRRRA